MATEFHFYQDALGRIDGYMTTYVGGTSAAVMGAFGGLAYTLLVLYTVFWGLAMLRGAISEPVNDGLFRILRMFVITGIAINAGRYSTFVSDWLWNTPEALSNVIATGSGQPAGNVLYLDSMMSEIFDIGQAYWVKASSLGSMIPDIGLMSCALLIWATGMAATGIGAALLLLSKVLLAVVLAIGPIFILMTLFDVTRRFFDMWLGQAINFVLVPVLSAALIRLMFGIIEAFMGVSKAGILEDPTVDLVVPTIVFCAITALGLWQVPSMASALGGGFALSTLGAVGWGFRKVSGAVTGSASAMRPTNLRRSINRARSDYLISKNAAHLVGVRMPAAIYRRVTGTSGNSVRRAG